MTATTTEPATTVTRSTTFDLIAPDAAALQVTRNAIARYRGACRQLYGTLLLSHAAGARLDGDGERFRLLPDNERAAQLLTLATGHGGKALAYQLRDWFRSELYPGSLSFVWDSARRDVATVWSSHDPEFPAARRGYLALQGARGIAQFQRRGIGFPHATGRPKLDGYTLTLKWDHAIGAVEFKLPNLDARRRHVWLSLRDGEWSLGTLYLNERDGRLLATITHERPADLREVDASRVCRLEFGDGPATFLRLRGPDGAATTDGIDAHAAVSTLARLASQMERRTAAIAASGNPRRAWGHRGQFRYDQEIRSGITRQRDRLQADYLHAWTRRCVDRAVAWRCGRLTVAPRPETLLGHPWRWAEFDAKLRWKAEAVGVAVELE